ncbi:acyltransferase [Siccirubricoccus sp. KC 17139]|uniref:Acyltransferase n=1 Tax=Siccirubricoccus soli TaxID=2899147 RepID=A0ABT1DCF4_9PROT|nr:acyltransferase [Siccirubricoccus soli]MCO6419584.1 acyltransferase [Siccirubricoccus soli]MCP2685719.1 acyltransferase [Siccirubricoccus soli]
MPSALSIYLDAIRLAAALVVFVGHISGARFTGGLFWQVGPYMDEAVTIFFVMSGFVIGHVVFDRRESAAAYAINRAARIASVAVPALMATLLLDTLGRAVNPGLYGAWWGFSDQDLPLQYLTSLLFVNQIWYLKLIPGSNLPYWSLGYEVWYYAIFGAAVFVRGRARYAAVLLLCAACGPAMLALFPVWLLGLLAQRLAAANRLPAGPGLALFLATLLGLGLYLPYQNGHPGLIPTLPEVFAQPRATHDYLTGLLVAANLVAFRAAAAWLGPLLLPFGRAIRWAAGATFTLYLFHLPVAQFLAALIPLAPDHKVTRLAVFGLSLVACFAIAEVTERRKEGWRRLLQRQMQRLQPRLASRA